MNMYEGRLLPCLIAKATWIFDIIRNWEAKWLFPAKFCKIFENCFETKGQSIKDVRTNREKLAPPPCPHWLKGLPPLTMQTHHKFQKIQVFLAKKCGRLHLKNPPPPLSAKCLHKKTPFPPDCGRLLWSAPNSFCLKIPHQHH